MVHSFDDFRRFLRGEYKVEFLVPTWYLIEVFGIESN